MWGCTAAAANRRSHLRGSLRSEPATQTTKIAGRRVATAIWCSASDGEGQGVSAFGGQEVDQEEEEEAEPYIVLHDGVHNSLREWARLRGVEWHGWDLASFPELNIRGAVALRDIREDDLLVSVPIVEGITLTPETDCPFPASFAGAAVWEGCGKWEYKMALSLLWDRYNVIFVCTSLTFSFSLFLSVSVSVSLSIPPLSPLSLPSSSASAHSPRHSIPFRDPPRTLTPVHPRPSEP